ncbi:hypothetical protein FH609_006755 [Streptomyces sp. 3MP-14]|uniref:Uncharacterized protein n=1 Tax=Streptomyces mimosae TaxID=2586635 RepID=A0A5N6AL74_9ACTN|nr:MULTISPECIES: DUF6153 family protein [Streptomyces]KAB8168882.1 hypothetical protein FH607_006610 [Streptomyces mimosae]KAB8177839.1 hypothetical protein FH609_006755 [Streptomyces sp. 3MP-14]
MAIRQPSPAPPHRAAPRLALLVGLVLAGLLAMHGLTAPAHPAAAERPPTSHGHGHERAAAERPLPGHGAQPAAAVSPHGPAASPADAACAHPDEGGAHAGHADTVCAAASLGGAPAWPGPTPAPAVTPDGADAVHLATPATPFERGPPDLSHLRVLRI